MPSQLDHFTLRNVQSYTLVENSLAGRHVNKFRSMLDPLIVHFQNSNIRFFPANSLSPSCDHSDTVFGDTVEVDGRAEEFRDECLESIVSNSTEAVVSDLYHLYDCLGLPQ